MPRCQICDRRRKHVSMMEIAGMLLAVCLRCRDQVQREQCIGKGVLNGSDVSGKSRGSMS